MKLLFQLFKNMFFFVSKHFCFCPLPYFSDLQAPSTYFHFAFTIFLFKRSKSTSIRIHSWQLLCTRVISERLYFNLPNHVGQGCAGSTRGIGAENVIVEPSSDFGLVCCIHFHTVILRKRLDSSHLPQATGNKAV